MTHMYITQEQYDADIRSAKVQVLRDLAIGVRNDAGVIGPDEINDIAAQLEAK